MSTRLEELKEKLASDRKLAEITASFNGIHLHNVVSGVTREERDEAVRFAKRLISGWQAQDAASSASGRHESELDSARIIANRAGGRRGTAPTAWHSAQSDGVAPEAPANAGAEALRPPDNVDARPELDTPLAASESATPFPAVSPIGKSERQDTATDSEATHAPPETLSESEDRIEPTIHEFETLEASGREAGNREPALDSSLANDLRHGVTGTVVQSAERRPRARLGFVVVAAVLIGVLGGGAYLLWDLLRPQLASLGDTLDKASGTIETFLGPPASEVPTTAVPEQAADDGTVSKAPSQPNTPIEMPAAGDTAESRTADGSTVSEAMSPPEAEPVAQATDEQPAAPSEPEPPTDDPFRDDALGSGTGGDSDESISTLATTAVPATPDPPSSAASEPAVAPGPPSSAASEPPVPPTATDAPDTESRPADDDSRAEPAAAVGRTDIAAMIAAPDEPPPLPEAAPDGGSQPEAGADAPAEDIAAETAPAVPAAALDKPGSDDRVLSTQRHLSRLGYDTGPVDGLLGPVTRRAVRDFQRDVGLIPDGEITDQLLEFLAGVNPPQE